MLVPSKPWQRAIIIVASGVLFCCLRQSVPLLGDGFLRVREISMGRLFSMTEPLTTVIHGALYRISSGLHSNSLAAQRSYVIISIISGLAMVFIYQLILSEWLGKSFWSGMALLFGLGFNLIFFGYVESYALFMLFVLWFVWMGTVSLKNDKYLIQVLFVYSMLVSLHAKGIFLLPALIFLLAVSWSSVRGKFPLVLLSLLAIPALTAIGGWLFIPRQNWTLSLKEIPHQAFLSFWDGLWGYGLFSPGHWLDIINQYFLIMAAGLFMLLMFTAGKRKKTPGKEEIFLTIASAGGLAFVWLADPKLGAARDWDLFAWIGIPPMVLILYLLKKNTDAARHLPVAGFLSVWLFLPWMLINAGQSLTVSRFLEILGSDKRSASYGYENLAIYYRNQGLDEKVEWIYEKGAKSDPANPRMLYNYGSALAFNGKTARAAEVFYRALEIDPTMADCWNNYGGALLKMGHYVQARQAAEKAVALDSTNRSAWYNLGIACSILRDWPRADAAFAEASSEGMGDGWLAVYWGDVQLHLGQYEKAARNFRLAIDAGIRDSVVIDGYRRAVSSLGRMR